MSRQLNPLLLPLGWLLIFCCALQAESPPAAPVRMGESIFAPASYTEPQLSPGGTKICALVRFDEKHYGLTLTDLSSKKTQVLAKSDDVTALDFWWKNDDLVLIRVEGDSGGQVFRTIDLRAGKTITLDDLSSFGDLHLVDPLVHDPEQMLFASFSAVTIPATTFNRDIVKINLRTGHETVVQPDPGGIQLWLANHEGNIIAGLGQRDERGFLIWRAKGSEKWQRTEWPKGELVDVIPFAVAPDGRRLIVQDFRKSPTAAIAYYDPASQAAEEVLPPMSVQPTQFEQWGYTQEASAVRYETDHVIKRYLKPEIEAIDQWLDKALPGTDHTFVSFCRDNHLAIILARNSQNPGIFFLANLATKTISALGPQYSTVNPKAMVPSRYFAFKARDGLPISGRITIPASKGKPPLLLIVGPHLDGPPSSADFDPEAQFFASRGYAVARIDHRGTSGFSRDFSNAGDFQITTGMVDDLLDGTKWLVDQQWVDGKHIGIFGQAEGGLTALSLASHSELFRALVNMDIPLDQKLWDSIHALSPSGRSEEALTIAIGGAKAANAYVKSIDAEATIETLTIPSFHYYHRTQNWARIEFEPESAYRLRDRLKKSRVNHEVVIAPQSALKFADQPASWKLKAQEYDEIAQFLDSNL